MERITPPEPRRNKDALYEAAGPAAHGAGLRPTGRGDPGPHRRPERIHRARHTRHGRCGISPSGKGEPRPSAHSCNRASVRSSSRPKTRSMRRRPGARSRSDERGAALERRRSAVASSALQLTRPARPGHPAVLAAPRASGPRTPPKGFAVRARHWRNFPSGHLRRADGHGFIQRGRSVGRRAAGRGVPSHGPRA